MRKRNRLDKQEFTISRIVAAIARRISEIPSTVSWMDWNTNARRNRHMLKQYHNLYKGERCFIIANGPSLKQTNLSLLKDDVTFGMNRIYLLMDKINFTPTYYIAMNELVLEQFSNDIRLLPIPKFLNWNRRKLFDKYENQVQYIKTKFQINDDFCTDITKPLSVGGTVTYAAMQVVYYMGFSQVILIGLDHNFQDKGTPNTTEIRKSNFDRDHFHPDYFPKGVKWQLPDLRRSELAYSVAKQAFERDGREILDATIAGKCSVFRKTEYNSLFE